MIFSGSLKTVFNPTKIKNLSSSILNSLLLLLLHAPTALNFMPIGTLLTQNSPYIRTNWDKNPFHVGYKYRLKPLQNLIFSIVIKNKFLKFQLVIFLKFVNLGVLQRFQVLTITDSKERTKPHPLFFYLF